jgi:predicted RNA-binding protein with TRAM domain
MWEEPNVGDIIEIDIFKLGEKGDGVGKTKTGLIVIVKGAKAGQTVKVKIVKVKPTFCFAEVQTVLKEPNTTDPSRHS